MLLIPPDLDRRTGPARGTAIRGFLLGALASGILLWLAIAAIGELLTGPLVGWNRSESALNRSQQSTGATDVELSEWPCRRQRRALRLLRHHGHEHPGGPGCAAP